MKVNNLERVRQKAMIFGQQFLQGDAGIFDQALSATAISGAQLFLSSEVALVQYINGRNLRLGAMREDCSFERTQKGRGR
jgi:hypothetical protein